MSFQKSKYLIVASFLLLGGCSYVNHYVVEQDYNDFTASKRCALRNNLLLNELEYTFGGAKGLHVELSLSKEKGNEIKAYFNMRNVSNSISFTKNSNFVFSLYDKEKEIKQIILPKPYLVDDGLQIIPGQYGSTYIFYNTAVTKIREKELIELARAEKVKFTLETDKESIKGTLNQSDLKPLREFVETCILNK